MTIHNIGSGPRVFNNGTEKGSEPTEFNFTTGVTVTVDSTIPNRVNIASSGGGGGSLTGPGSSTDNAVTRWDGTAGDTLQNSTVTISDGGSITLPALQTVDGRDVSVDGTAMDAFIASKAAASGLASLDGSTKVPIAQIPTGTTSSTVPFGNDSRFSDSRAPNGSAGGDLGGTYPNPTVVSAAGTFALLGDITPTALSGSVNDYAPTGLSGASVIRQDASTTSTITGLTGGTDGRLLVVSNISTTNTITLTQNDAASAAANRLFLPGGVDKILQPRDRCVLLYDTTNSVWRVIAHTAVFGTTAGTYTQGTDSRLSDSRAPNGSAGGGLAGTYPNPTVNGMTSGVLTNDTAHGNRGGGGIHADVVAAGASGFMNGTDKTKLDALNSSNTGLARLFSEADGYDGANASLTGALTENIKFFSSATTSGTVTPVANAQAMCIRVAGTFTVSNTIDLNGLATSTIVAGQTGGTGGTTAANGAQGTASTATSATHESAFATTLVQAGGAGGTSGTAGNAGGGGGAPAGGTAGTMLGGAGGGGGGGGGSATNSGPAGRTGGQSTASTLGAVKPACWIFAPETFASTTFTPANLGNMGGGSAPGGAGSGGAGGAGGSGGVGGDGGSGVRGGGGVWIGARSVTGSGTIRANGATGNNGTNGANSGATAGGGGGGGGGSGGGGGGLIIIKSPSIGGGLTIQANGGTAGSAGSAGNGNTTGQNGGAGGGGQNGGAGVVWEVIS